MLFKFQFVKGETYRRHVKRIVENQFFPFFSIIPQGPSVKLSD